MIFSQFRALSHNFLHGGIGYSKIVHNGAYNEHKNNFKSGEQLILISGIN